MGVIAKDRIWNVRGTLITAKTSVMAMEKYNEMAKAKGLLLAFKEDLMAFKEDVVKVNLDLDYMAKHGTLLTLSPLQQSLVSDLIWNLLRERGKAMVLHHIFTDAEEKELVKLHFQLLLQMKLREIGIRMERKATPITKAKGKKRG